MPVQLLETEVTSITMEEFLQQMTQFSTWSFQQLGQAWTFISGNPMLMVGIGMVIIGFIVGLWHRFAR